MDRSSQENISHRIIRAIADAEEVPRSDLPPLWDSVDIEALQAFLQSSSGSAKAEFRYLDRRIKLRADGALTISEPNSEQDQYIARCNTCGEMKRNVELETAQDFFETHVDRGHAVEINRSSGGEPYPSAEAESETGHTEETN